MIHHPQTLTLAVQAAELAFAVPQVVAHRLTRMALSGPVLSARDRREFTLMGAEKAAAFTESWIAMGFQVMQAQQAMATSWLRSAWTPWVRTGSVASLASHQWQNAALHVLGKGMAPVHRKAVANARRLAGTRLR